MTNPIPFWAEGVWHVFYPKAVGTHASGAASWEHASSTNLYDWTRHTATLVADGITDSSAGFGGGSIVAAGGDYYALYTRLSGAEGGVQVQCVARSTDLEGWTNLDVNPILVTPPPGFGPFWRDPCVFREGDQWRMLIGSQREGIGGALLLYESDDLAGWRYVGVALLGERDQTGTAFESPDLFPLGDRYVLLSSRGAVHWQVGDWDGRRFYPIKRGTCDGPPYTRFTHGASPLHRAKSTLGPDGRRILFGSLRETQDGVDREWSGVQALPRDLRLLEDGALGMGPARETRGLRREHDHLAVATFPVYERTPLPALRGACLCFSFRASGDEPFSIVLRADERGHGTEVRYDVETRALGGAPVGRGPVEVEGFVDGSIIEIFANGRACVSRRTYAPESQDAAFFLTGAKPVPLEWRHVWHPCGRVDRWVSRL
jgi:beta-fructofuranosidase